MNAVPPCARRRAGPPTFDLAAAQALRERAAVVGQPDPHWQEVPGACVVRRGQLAGFKVPHFPLRDDLSNQ